MFGEKRPILCVTEKKILCQTDEFVHISFFGWCSFFLFYDIKKWPLTEGAGWWMAECDDFKRGYWSRVEIPTRMQIFFLLIFVYKFTSTNS